MRIKKPYLVITFSATAHATKMEHSSKLNNIPGRIIPIPAKLSAGCGLAWQAEPSDESYIIDFMSKNQIPYEAVSIVDFWTTA